MRRSLAVVTAVVAVLAVGAAVWWWYDGRGERRADGLRDDVAALPGVTEVVDVDDLAEVRLASDATAGQVAKAFEAAERYRDSFEDADRVGGVAVRRGAAFAYATEDSDRVDPELLLAAGSWSAPDDVDLQLLAVEDDVWITATSPSTPAVTTLAWLAEQVARLDGQVRAGVGEIAGDDEATGTHARMVGAALDDPGAVGPVLATVGRLADLDPTVILVGPEDWFLDIGLPAGQVDETRARVAQVLRAYPDLVVEDRVVGDQQRVTFSTPGGSA